MIAMMPGITKILIALLVLINPMTVLPAFISLTADNSSEERRKIARTACVAIFVSITIVAVCGNSLLHLLSISMGSFQVGGGILVLLIAIAMMSAQPHPSKTNAAERQEAEYKNSIAVVPLAIPLLVGPGTVSTVIIYAAGPGWSKVFQVIVAGLIVASVCYAVMRFADRIARWLGRTGINIINRVMGMILAALSVEIIAAGLKNLFPILN